MFPTPTFSVSKTQLSVAMTGYPDYFATHDHSEGYFEIDDYELFYRKFGSGDDVLVALHGGPGMPHDYLAPLVQHAGEDLTVYLYDQFGVGHSDKPAPGTSTATRSSTTATSSKQSAGKSTPGARSRFTGNPGAACSPKSTCSSTATTSMP